MLYYMENQIAELAEIINAAANVHGAPNFALDLMACAVTKDGTINQNGLRSMATRWREVGMVPENFADRIVLLASGIKP